MIFSAKSGSTLEEANPPPEPLATRSGPNPDFSFLDIRQVCVQFEASGSKASLKP